MSTHNKRFVPHASLYDTAARLNKYAQILLYISSLLSLIISAIDYLKNWNDLNTPRLRKVDPEGLAQCTAQSHHPDKF